MPRELSEEEEAELERVILEDAQFREALGKVISRYLRKMPKEIVISTLIDAAASLLANGTEGDRNEPVSVGHEMLDTRYWHWVDFVERQKSKGGQ